MIPVDPSWVTWIHNPFPSLTMFGYSTLLNEIYLYSVGMYWRRFVWLNKQKNSSKQHIKRLPSASWKLLNSPFIQLCYLFMHCTEEYNLVTDGIWCRWIWYRSWIIPISWSTKIHGWKRYPFSNLLLFTLVLPHNWGGNRRRKIYWANHLSQVPKIVSSLSAYVLQESYVCIVTSYCAGGDM